MNKHIILAICTMALPLVTCAQQANATRYRGPRCLGEFCFDGALTSIRQLISRFGPKTSEENVFCYQAVDQGAYVYFIPTDDNPPDVIELLVTQEPNCAPASGVQPPKQRFQRFITREGIGLGDAEERVLTVYGAPSQISGDDFELRRFLRRSGNTAVKTLFYSAYLSGDESDLTHAAFYIRHGKVVGILLSRNE